MKISTKLTMVMLLLITYLRVSVISTSLGLLSSLLKVIRYLLKAVFNPDDGFSDGSF